MPKCERVVVSESCFFYNVHYFLEAHVLCLFKEETISGKSNQHSDLCRSCSGCTVAVPAV